MPYNGSECYLKFDLGHIVWTFVFYSNIVYVYGTNTHICEFLNWLFISNLCIENQRKRENYEEVHVTWMGLYMKGFFNFWVLHFP